MNDPHQTIGEIIRYHARISPDAPAIRASTTHFVTYADLAHCLERIRTEIRDWGIGREDRIAFYSPDRATMAVCFLAAADCGTAVPIDGEMAPDQLAAYLAEVRATILIADQRCNPGIGSAAQSVGLTVIKLSTSTSLPAGTFSLQTPNRKSRARVCQALESDIALVLRTAGTTSGAKLVPLSHVNLVDRAIKKGRWLGLTSDDCAIHLMPLHHGHGINSALLPALVAGGSLVFLSEFDEATFFELMDRHQPTWYSASPTFHQAILSQVQYYPDVVRRSKLRVIASSSGGLPATVLSGLESAFETKVVEKLDLSEAGTLAGRPMAESEIKPGTVGKIIPDAVAVMDPFGVILPYGQTGEIVTRGPSVFSGYEISPEANATAFVNGWFRTGDMGSIDSDGYLTLQGRIKEIINRGGEKISPLEIEESLLAHPDVDEAVAFPIAHTSLGEIVGAAIVPRAGSKPVQRDLKNFLLDRLTRAKVPVTILLVDKVPKNAIGKVTRYQLAQYFGLNKMSANA